MILKPDYNLKTVFDIDENLLKSENIEMLLFDLDSTVMASKTGVFTDETLEFLNRMKKHFKIAILSNNKNISYLEKAEAYGICDVIGHANKPSPKKALCYIKDNNVVCERVAVVGDRPLTDILVGKLLGSKTILVDSITYKTEPKLTRFARFLERLFIRNF